MTIIKGTGITHSQPIAYRYKVRVDDYYNAELTTLKRKGAYGIMWLEFETEFDCVVWCKKQLDDELAFKANLQSYVKACERTDQELLCPPIQKYTLDPHLHELIPDHGRIRAVNILVNPFEGGE